MVEERDVSYRDSHAAPGYGQHYDKTYQHGYYAEQWRQIERPLVHEVMQQVVGAGAKSLLDFACGTGRILALAEEVFGETWGVDVSPTMQEIARERCRRSTLVLQDISKDPLSRRFDAVTAFRFFLNAEEPLRRAILRAIEEALAPGGVLIANVHVNATSPLGLFYRARNRLRLTQPANTLSHDAFRQTVEACGLSILQTWRYAYLPRPGPLLPGIVGAVMGPVERLCGATGLVPASAAQSFLVVCGRPGDTPRFFDGA
ncbi:MAG: class I SAM-dependent methyltransferase [Myxococcota bacterium]